MASAEIDLPKGLSADQTPLATHQIIKDESEKVKHEDSCNSSIILGGSNDIQWHYLTFETHLPAPAYTHRHSDSQDVFPPPSPRPNLKQYESPFEWSETRKTLMTWLSCTATTLTAYTAGSYSPGIPQMTALWGISDVTAEVGITIFTIGFGIAPMFLAPFSEINGRRPVFVVTGLFFVLFQLICGLTPTWGGMLVARFLAGCMSSTFSTMVGGVVSDLYHAKDRNTAMALFTAAALFGTGLGPMISGFIASHTTWRWCFYLQAIDNGVLMVVILFFFRETRGSVLLSRKAKVLNQWYDQLESEGYHGVMMPTLDDSQKLAPQRIRWKVKADEERGSLLQMIRISLWRPIHMLFTEPTVLFFSIWISFAWAVLYLTLAAIPLIFETTYRFTLEQAFSVFAAMSVAAILFTFVAIYQERFIRRFLPERHCKILERPEGRLYFCCVQSFLLPIGCVWLGVTGAYPSVPWIVPALGVGCATMGIFSIYLAVFNYLADSYHRYASSALAAQSCCRNFVGGAFPLFTSQMFTTLTFQGAGGLLGGIGFILTIVPWVLLIWGPKIRARSKFASEAM